MINNKKEFRGTLGGQDIVIETGKLAKQADGAVLISSGGTQVLVTACSSKELKEGQDFFPLTVDYIEKFYAAGKFLGGFLKRENRPSVKEILTARLIDRPLRPLFPEGYMYETSVMATVLSYEPGYDPEVLAALGASAALSVSDIPFNDVIATCKVGRFNGEFKANPADFTGSDLELLVSASENAILMVEGEAHLISEEDMLAALNFAHNEIKNFCKTINELKNAVGKKKRDFTPSESNKKLLEVVTAKFKDNFKQALSITPKLERANAVKDVQHLIGEYLSTNYTEVGLSLDADFKVEAFKVTDAILYNVLRSDILDNDKRIGGRKLNEVRPIETEVGTLLRTHGSALFTRGETQVLATVTMGGESGDQMVDRITGVSYDKFYLHYNFPSFSVGESRTKNSVGRRELGHGNLAQRALASAISKDCPYTIRVCCEVLESNGSSSMGSVCAGSLALMDAGVKTIGPVAGVAMGLVTDGSRFKILTDILGDEDHLGDMDFKVAGTATGITAIQMDIKIGGLTFDIISAALSQAKEGRLSILNEMAKTMTESRAEVKSFVPKMETLKIKPDSIGALIGSGGKNIKSLQERHQVTIECSEEGLVRVIGIERANLNTCKDEILLQINGPEIGSVYDATVVSIKEYGAFADIVPGVSGLVHISEFAKERVKDAQDYVSVGDVIKVKVIEIDNQGRVKLSAKQVAPLKIKNENKN